MAMAMSTDNARERFQRALDSLIEQVKNDRHILAAVLCGSLSHDQVYDKSDIDLVLVCADDKKMKGHGVSLVVDDINIHTSVTPRDAFKKTIEGTVRNSVAHSLYAKGTLLFTTDPSIERVRRHRAPGCAGYRHATSGCGKWRGLFTV